MSEDVFEDDIETDKPIEYDIEKSDEKSVTIFDKIKKHFVCSIALIGILIGAYTYYIKIAIPIEQAINHASGF